MVIAQLQHHILLQMPTLSPAEVAELSAAFTLHRLKKRQFLVQPGQVAEHNTYVVTGAFRSFLLDTTGVEHTIQFAVDDWWITDANSYHYRQPARLTIVALEDSTVFQLDFATEQHLKLTNHHFETFFRLRAERVAAYHQRRLISALTLTAKERYVEFVATYPTIFQRLPQQVIAAYLGMSREFLSRIRNHGGT